MRNDIEKLISEELSDDDKTVANNLVEYLRKNNYLFYRDECEYWKNKIGTEFKTVCGCTFRFDNPQINDLQFIKYMIEANVKQINNI